MSEAWGVRVAGPSAGEIDELLRALALPSGAVGDAERIDRIAAMERLKSALSAAQARETVAFKVSQEQRQVEAGVASSRVGGDVGSQVGLARRVSPWSGGRLVGLAAALVGELPATLAVMTAGRCSEKTAMIVARETAFLVPPDRRLVDAALAVELGGLSDREVEARARAHAYRLDPAGFVRRAGHAEADRYVSFRAAPDTMVQLSALLPLRAGIATQQALREAAAAAKAAGDVRSRAQLMADTLFERVTGASSQDRVPVQINLVMTDQTLLGDSDEPAQVSGHGPVPAPLARRWLRELPDDTTAWLRRLYTAPGTGRLLATESTRRCFDGLLRQSVVIRDQFCRTPFCNATISHVDHVSAVDQGGATSEANGQGLCEHCNYVKILPGWHTRPEPDGGAGATVTVTTPTGHSYLSTPPPLPGSRAPCPSPDQPKPAPARRWTHDVEVYYQPRQHEDAA